MQRSQWHEWSDDEHSVYFEMELVGEEVVEMME